MTDAAKKKVASTAGAASAKGQKESKSMPSFPEVTPAGQSMAELDAMLAGLGPRIRRAFLLSQLDGMTYRLIGEELGVSEVTVTRYIAKAFHHCTLYSLQADS